MAVQKMTPVVCPNCQARFNAPVNNIIDGQDPVQKSSFLQGQLNVVQCPQCGFTHSLTVPVLYYDLEKEVAFVLAPADMSVAADDQEKMIGDLTNELVNNLPQEQRKYYLLNPKRFLSHDSMVRAVLEAEGISGEELDAQATRARLIEEFLQAPNEATLKEKVEAHDDQLDYEFFETLTAYMQAAQMEGNQEHFQAFFGLRQVLSEWSSQGQEAVKKIDKELGLLIVKNQDELLTRLREANNDQELEQLIGAGHALLDYTFFQKLTSQIDSATKKDDKATANELKALRTKILDIKSQQEEQSRAAVEKAAGILRDIIQSSQPEKVVDEKLDQIDEAFFYILQANIQEAKRQKQEDAAKGLESIGNLVYSKLQQRQAPQTAKPAEAATSQGDQPAEEAPSSTIHIAKK